MKNKNKIISTNIKMVIDTLMKYLNNKEAVINKYYIIELKIESK